MPSISKSGSDPGAGPGDAAAPVAGSWFAAGAAQRHDGTLAFRDGVLVVESADGGGTTCPGAEAKVADFGDAVTIEFPDGSAFVIASGQAATAALLAALTSRARVVTRLERRWQTVLVAMAGTVAIGALLLLVVLPALTKPAAFLIPPGWARLIDEQTLEIFDRTVVDPSRLPEDARARIEEDLQELIAGLGLDAGRYQLVFRSGEAIGANAFALPGGTIIVTDRMAELATPEELAGVLAHEIGHVERRHGLQMILRKSTLAIILVTVGPDAGTISELAQGLPAVLLESGYSRAFEREADLYACRAFARLDRDPAALAGALERLAAEHPSDDPTPAWIASHPETDERIATIRAYDPVKDAGGD